MQNRADLSIKESRLLVEFREQDSYINSDYDSDSSVPPPILTNSLLTNARILAAAAASYPRTPGLPPPRLRYVLTRLPESGHSDPRVGETLSEMRRLGIKLEFADTEWPIPNARRIPTLRPAEDIVLDLSILIALCCDSTHHPLPRDEWELESRFRTMRLADDAERSEAEAKAERGEVKAEKSAASAQITPAEFEAKAEGTEAGVDGESPEAGVDGESTEAVGEGNETKAGRSPPRLILGRYTNATRDLRDQLRCELARPLITELMSRLPEDRSVRFWVTREVRDRLPTLVDVIGGEREQYRARAMFGDEDFWRDSRWEGVVGENLRDLKVGVLEDLDPIGQVLSTGAGEAVEGGDGGEAGAEEGDGGVEGGEAREAAKLPSPFDAAVAHVCREMLRITQDTPPSGTPLVPGTPALKPSPPPGTPSSEATSSSPSTANPTSQAKGAPAPEQESAAQVQSEAKPQTKGKPKSQPKGKSKPSKNPARARAGTRFVNSKLPSGHTLRTLLAGIERRMTVLTNNRGAVLKVLREEGVMEGIPFAWSSEEGFEEGQGEEADGDASRARIWIVNPSSLAEWRREQVEKGNAELLARYPDAVIDRTIT